MGDGPLKSRSAGILELGLTATKPEPNWSPSVILISQAAYSAPLLLRASNSSSINRPIPGPTHDKELPVGRHPLQLYSLGKPNGGKVRAMLDEFLARKRR